MIHLQNLDIALGISAIATRFMFYYRTDGDFSLMLAWKTMAAFVSTLKNQIWVVICHKKPAC